MTKICSQVRGKPGCREAEIDETGAEGNGPEAVAATIAASPVCPEHGRLIFYRVDVAAMYPAATR